MRKRVVKTLDVDVRRLSMRFMQDLNTPISLGVYLRIKYGEWDSLASCKVDPWSYQDTVSGTEKFRRDYQAVELLRKYEELPTSIDRKKVALDGFWASEAQCCVTNVRLERYFYLPTEGNEEPRVLKFIADVKKLIRSILGPLPSELQGRFGPGAVFESQGHPHAKRFVLGDKMQLKPASTAEAWHINLHTVLGTAYGRAVFEGVSTPFADPLEGCVVRGNRFTTVPKDCTKDRGICIEPGLNVFSQLGVGAYIRKMLLRRGVDLDYGQQKHHDYAQAGSLSGSLATIDLSSASDTVSTNLVRLLLPGPWYELLSSLRSAYTRLHKKRGSKGEQWVRLEKFSSMGNGFTFELESLIFYAISKVACGQGDALVSVYGDDIIVPTRNASDVLAALKFFGFQPNSRKTFLGSAFRESCGGDFFQGVNVTPYRLKNEPKQPSDWISVANGLWAWAGLAKFPNRYNPAVRARSTALGVLPFDIRKCTGPERLGDLVIHDYPSSWSHYRPRSNGITYGRVWRPVPVKVSLRHFTPHTQLALALYGASSSGLTPRNGVSGYRFGRVSFS